MNLDFKMYLIKPSDYKYNCINTVLLIHSTIKYFIFFYNNDNKN